MDIAYFSTFITVQPIYRTESVFKWDEKTEEEKKRTCITTAKWFCIASWEDSHLVFTLNVNTRFSLVYDQIEEVKYFLQESLCFSLGACCFLDSLIKLK
ncbi:hypothetical protein TNCT_341411 [Trichonephila clavata]|uniref:Uncharacterized protein n=1 Tax=Trichonephila clavata TaxID=2740835 RepID=A0A8X6FP21_TRICU|nr:hypothetical protein TNCT_341411 [Trichonephila clavata]